jgi:hypothetical protein
MSPNRLFCVFETSITVVQRETSRFIALKGEKRSYRTFVSREMILINIPHVHGRLGYFRANPSGLTTKEYEVGAPPTQLEYAIPHGGHNREFFSKLFQHFIENVKPSPDDPVLLALDGHCSHTRNVQMTRANGVAIVRLPTHWTHKMQPIGVPLSHIMARRLRAV